MVGPRPGRPVVGCAAEHLKTCRARAFMGGASRCCTELTAVSVSIVGRACGPVMGTGEDPRTRGADSAVVVRAVGGSATAAPSTANTCATATRACRGPIVVAAF